ncbi:MAG: hypothetical protein ABJD11_18430 [Gemmatimonadota bacterium]
MKRIRPSFALLCLLAACAPKGGDKVAADSTPSMSAVPDSTPAPPSAPMKAEPMMASMHAHLDSLTAKPTALHGEMAAHTTMVMGLVDAMKSDLATVGYNDAGYQALADSVVQDLTALPKLAGAAARKAEQAHLERVQRLMGAYETAVAKK